MFGNAEVVEMDGNADKSFVGVTSKEPEYDSTCRIPLPDHQDLFIAWRMIIFLWLRTSFYYQMKAKLLT